MCDPTFDKEEFARDVLVLTRELNGKLGDVEERLYKALDDGACTDFMNSGMMGLMSIQIRVNTLRDASMNILAEIMSKEDFQQLVRSWNEDHILEHTRRFGEEPNNGT